MKARVILIVPAAAAGLYGAAQLAARYTHTHLAAYSDGRRIPLVLAPRSSHKRGRPINRTAGSLYTASRASGREQRITISDTE